MATLYTIGRLAKAAEVPTSTVRYYEREGLLRPDGRSQGNYRLYAEPALVRLRFIRAAQANGFTLEDVGALLAFRDGRTAPCREVQALIQERLADLGKRIRQMGQVRAVLRTSLRACRKAETLGRCVVMENLNRGSSSPRRTLALRRRKKSKNPLDLELGFKA